MDISPEAPNTQNTDHMKLKKKEEQRVDASVLLRRGNKIIKGRGWEGLGKKRGEGREGKRGMGETGENSEGQGNE